MWSVTQSSYLDVTGADFDENYALSHPALDVRPANQDTSLTTAPINTLGTTNIRLSFSERFVGYESIGSDGLLRWAQGELSFSTDSGQTWHVAYVRRGAPSTQSETTSIMLPQAANQADLRLRWRYIGGNGAPAIGTGPPTLYWAIDAVQLVDTGAAPLAAGNTYLINGEDFPAAGLFPDFSSAVAHVNERGVAGEGDILFEFYEGYDGTEPGTIVIQNIGGLYPNAERRLVFRPAAGRQITTTFPQDDRLILNSGNVLLDGRPGGVGGDRAWTLSAYDGVVRILAYGDRMLDIHDLEIRNLEMISQGKRWAYHGLLSSLDITAHLVEIAGLTVRDCRIGGEGGETAQSVVDAGISISGGHRANQGLVITGNLITNTLERGIVFNGRFIGASISDNRITTTEPLPISPGFTGIFFDTIHSPGVVISGNVVHGIEMAPLAHIPFITGIRLDRSNSTGEPVRAFNNIVHLDGNGTTLIGISTGGPGLMEVDHNTVVIEGETPTGSGVSSRAFQKSGSAILSLRNNLFVNNRGNGENATGNHFAIQSNNTQFADIGFNNYFADGEGGILGNVSSGSAAGHRLTLTEWMDSVAGERESISMNPAFIDREASPAGLGVDPAVPTPIESGGTPLAHVTVDISGTPRHPHSGHPEHPDEPSSAPDIGAYEFAGQYVDQVAPTITYGQPDRAPATDFFAFPPVSIGDRSGVDLSAGNAPRLYYRRAADADAWHDNTAQTDGWKYVEMDSHDGGVFHFILNFGLLHEGGVELGDQILYFIVARDLSPAANLAVSPYVGWNEAPASTTLDAAQFPLSAPPRSFMIVPSYSGIHTAGQDGDFPTVQAAIDAFAAGVFVGPVTLELADAIITASVSVPPLPTGQHGLTIRPIDGVGITWSPPSIHTGPPLSVRGTENLVIDGDDRITLLATNNAGSALVISPAAAPGSPAWMTNGQRPRNVEVRGLEVRTSHNTATTGFDSGYFSTGIQAHGDLLHIHGNTVRKAGVGIDCSGTDNLIENNVIGSEEAGDHVTGAGIKVTGSGAGVIGNDLRNIRTTALNGANLQVSRVRVPNPVLFRDGLFGIVLHGDDARVLGNRVAGFGSGLGITHASGIFAAGDRNLLANNLVLGEPPARDPRVANLQILLRLNGIELHGRDIDVLHNTVNLAGDFAERAPHLLQASALTIHRRDQNEGIHSSGIHVRNNLFRNTLSHQLDDEGGGFLRFGMIHAVRVEETGSGIPAGADPASVFDHVNDNLYHAESFLITEDHDPIDLVDFAVHGTPMPDADDPVTLINWYLSLNPWQTFGEWRDELELDPDSTHQPPGIVSDADPTPTGGSPLLSAAIPVDAVTTDYLGNPRDPVAPTIGAIEEPLITSDPPVIISFTVHGGSPVTTASALLVADAEDDGGAEQITYTWSLVAGPEGAPISFSPEQSLGHPESVVGFSIPGTYTFRVRATDAENQHDEADLQIEVVSTPSGLRIDEADAVLNFGEFRFFSAYQVDQFGVDVEPAWMPGAQWAVSGGGTISADTGGFFADQPPSGTYTLSATSGGLFGETTLTVRLDPAGQIHLTSPTGTSFNIPEGDTLELTALAYGIGDLTFQWYAGFPGDTSEPLGDPIVRSPQNPGEEHLAEVSFNTPPISEGVHFWLHVTNPDEHWNQLSFSVFPSNSEMASTYGEWLAAMSLDGHPDAGPEASLSRDGIPNLVKYALGLDPRDPVVNGEGLPVFSIEDMIDWGSGEFEPHPHAVLRFAWLHIRSDILVEVEWSEDLDEWHYLHDDFDPEEMMENGREPRMAVIRITPERATLFLRLKVRFF